MTHFVRVVDGEVKDVWNTPPTEGVGNNGWRNAIEVRAALIPNRQGYTPLRYNLDTDPVEIIWDAYDFTVDERRYSQIADVRQAFQQAVVQQTQLQLSMDPNEQFDISAIETAKQIYNSKIAALEAATTHDDLDALL